MIARRKFLLGLVASSATTKCFAGTASSKPIFAGLMPGRSSAEFNAYSLHRAFDALSRRPEGRLILPKGVFFTNGLIKTEIQGEGSWVVDGDETRLIFTGIGPRKNRPYIWIRGDQVRGSSIRMMGVSLALDRPSVRIAGSDLVRLSGFDQYDVSDLSLLSADNMALTIGRSDKNGWVPRSINVTACSLGGLRFEAQHSHGSIGDSAIWIVSPAKNTLVRNNVITETGDDAIYVGHATNSEPVSILIENNVIRNTVGGIGVSVPNSVIRNNRLQKTSVCAIRTENQNGYSGSGANIVENIIENPGQLELGDIAINMIPKVHPHGIFLYNSGKGARLERNVVRGSRGSGVAILAPMAGSMTVVSGSGDRFEFIGVDRYGRQLTDRKGIAAYSKYSGRGRVNGLSAVDIHLGSFSVPVINWSLNQEDVDVTVDASVADLKGGRSPDMPVATFKGVAGGGKLVSSLKVPAELAGPVMIDGNSAAINVRVVVSE